eukprot:3532707-Pyramimonas_sp.AAC.1
MSAVYEPKKLPAVGTVSWGGHRRGREPEVVRGARDVCHIYRIWREGHRRYRTRSASGPIARGERAYSSAGDQSRGSGLYTAL